jgi:hypothetical protein
MQTGFISQSKKSLIFANMKFRSALAYYILAVYSLILVDTVIPHDHDHPIHDCLNQATTVYCLPGIIHHHNGSERNHEHKQEHKDHQLPHHEESQHPGDYTLNRNPERNLLSQLALLTAYCSPLLAFDLTPAVTDIDRQDIYYIPVKTPIQFSDAVPLRAPPVV